MREKAVTKNRNSSVELLRIIAILGVVILHYNNAAIGGAFKYVPSPSLKEYYLFFTECLFIAGVNIFYMISAYYLSKSNKRKLSKVVDLIIQVIIFNLMFYIVNILKGGNLSFKGLFYTLLPANYFVTFYAVIYIISPYINILINKLNKKQFKKLVIIMFIIFSLITTFVDIINNIFNSNIYGLSPVSMFGSDSGYTIINVILVYLIGAYIGKNKINIKRVKNISLIMILVLLLFGWVMLERKLGFSSITGFHYNNPLVILISALTIILFTNINFNNKVINELAKATFTCFIFHIHYISYFGIEKFAQSNLIILIIHQFFVSIFLFIVSYIVYKVYSFFIKYINRIIHPLCNKINIEV